MKFSITSRHFKSWPELQEAVKVASDNIEKLFPGITSTEVVLSEEHGKEVEFIVHIQNHVINAKHSASDFDKSISAASEKVLSQLKKIKEKQTDHRR